MPALDRHASPVIDPAADRTDQRPSVRFRMPHCPRSARARMTLVLLSVICLLGSGSARQRGSVDPRLPRAGRGRGRDVRPPRDGEVEHIELRIFEPPRFFEALLRGRSFLEAPDITARICGICPVAYQMSAVQAMEDACGVEVSEPIRPCGASSTAASGSRATRCTSTCSTRPTSSATRAPSSSRATHRGGRARARAEEDRERGDGARRRA